MTLYLQNVVVFHTVDNKLFINCVQVALDFFCFVLYEVFCFLLLVGWFF